MLFFFTDSRKLKQFPVLPEIITELKNSGILIKLNLKSKDIECLILLHN